MHSRVRPDRDSGREYESRWIVKNRFPNFAIAEPGEIASGVPGGLCKVSCNFLRNPRDRLLVPKCIEIGFINTELRFLLKGQNISQKRQRLAQISQFLQFMRIFKVYSFSPISRF